MKMNVIKTAIIFAILFVLPVDVLAKPANPIDDVLITDSVKNKISQDPLLNTLTIQISTENNVVSIVGEINSDEQASALIQSIQSTAGVENVEVSKLVITNGKLPFAEVVITAKIKGKLMQKKLFGDQSGLGPHINVEWSNDVVYLTGTAENQQQIDEAVQIAKSVSGVSNVISNVRVMMPSRGQ